MGGVVVVARGRRSERRRVGWSGKESRRSGTGVSVGQVEKS